MNTRRDFLKTLPTKLFGAIFCGSAATLAAQPNKPTDINRRIKDSILQVLKEEKRLQKERSQFGGLDKQLKAQGGFLSQKNILEHLKIKSE